MYFSPIAALRSFLRFSLVLTAICLAGCRQGDLWSGVNNGDIFDEPDATIDEMLNELAEAEMRVLRVWVDFRLEMDADGNALPVGEYDDCILAEIDDLMARAKRRGILLLIALHQHNWIGGTPYRVNEASHGWRSCRTPLNTYADSLELGSIDVRGPYFQRGWSEDYLTNEDARNAYKQRVDHILNHVNPHFGRAWKDMDDVVWAWELQNEPEYLLENYTPGRGGDTTDLRSWFDEMASYVKSIDPNTYVALGTMDFNEDIGNIADADIYTLHKYPGLPGNSDVSLQLDIDEFNAVIGGPFDKLLVLEELNVFGQHAPGNFQTEFELERFMEICRANGIPWMLWEHGYGFDQDDIWHANGVANGMVVPDGAFWGAKAAPGAMKIWEAFSLRSDGDRQWNVHEQVNELCSVPDSICQSAGRVFFIDTFSGDDVGDLSVAYDWFDEHTFTFSEDSYSLSFGYLDIFAGLGQDLWGGSPPKRGAPLLLYPAPEENYVVETFVKARQVDPGTRPLQPLNTQMGLFVFEDVSNWIFFGLTHHEIDSTRVDGLIVTSTSGDISSVVAEVPWADDFAFLRIRKAGRRWNFEWRSENGEDWRFVTSFRQSIGRQHKVGMGVKTFDFGHPQLYGPAEANFDYFLITDRLPLPRFIPPRIRPNMRIPFVREAAAMTALRKISGSWP